MKKKVKNVSVQPDALHEIVDVAENKLRKKLIQLKTAGLTFQEKKELVLKELIKTYGEVPNGISIVKRITKKTDVNPDGLRILVNCDWIKRNRFNDYHGIFRFGRLVKAINKEIEGKTRDSIKK